MLKSYKRTWNELLRAGKKVGKKMGITSEKEVYKRCHKSELGYRCAHVVYANGGKECD